MTRRLRLAQLIVQPVLVWDDGVEMTPGPRPDPIPLPLGGLSEFAERFPVDLAALEVQLLAQEAAEEPAPKPVHNGRVTTSGKGK